MDFAKHQNTFLRIKAKYRSFEVNNIYYDVIESKLAEIESDLLNLNEISKWLVIRRGVNDKYNILLVLVGDLEAYLDGTVGAVKERIEYLEAMKESYDGDSDEEAFERNFCTPPCTVH